MDLLAFVCDAETKTSLEVLVKSYWDAGMVLEGGSKAAVEYDIGSFETIKFLIVDISDAEDVRSVCHSIMTKFSSSQAVLFIGSVNDVALYRDLVRAGAADYVVKPVNEEEIYKALITSLKSKVVQNTAFAEIQGGNKPAKLITIIGARGGAGTTSLLVNAGWILANTHQQNVVLIDMDVHFGTIALALDAKPSIGFKDALQDPSRVDAHFVEGCLVKVTPKLSILAAEENMRDYVVFNDNAIRLLLEKLRENKDYIIVDTPRSSLVRCPQIILDADYIVLVTELTVPSLRDTVTIINQIKSIVTSKKIIIVANKVRSGASGQVSLQDFASQIDTKISVVLPHAPEVIEKALNDGKAAALQDPKSKIIREINNFCDILLEKKTQGALLTTASTQRGRVKDFLGKFK
jgi:pilus assembly protein CpaE